MLRLPSVNDLKKFLTLVLLAATPVEGLSQDATSPTSTPVATPKSSPFAEPAPHSDWSFFEASMVPIQNGGRIKPLDEFAREIVLLLTESRAKSGWNPVDLMFSFMAFPDYWLDQAFIKVSNPTLKKQLVLEESKNYFSPRELLSNSAVVQYATLGQGQSVSKDAAPGVQAEKADPREQDLQKLIQRVVTFQMLTAGNAWTIIPGRDSEAPWGHLRGNETEGEIIRRQFGDLLKAYLSDNQEVFERQATGLRAAVEGSISKFENHDRQKLMAEWVYNNTRPFFYATWIYLAAAILWMWRSAYALTILGFLVHSFGFGLRCFIAGRPPVTNMYESVLWVAYGVLIFAFWIYRSQKQKVVMSVATFLAALMLLAADASPAVLDPGLHPLVPVLRSNYWLLIHVLTITISYAAFALSFGLGNVTLFHFMRPTPASALKISSLNQLMYRALQAGVVLLAAGTILGGIWADYSWGRFWGWDPKEVWALISLLAYLAVLHARYTGWVGKFAFPLWTVLNFLTVLMAWYGVNFVLGVGLHSYGFSTGGQLWVGIFVVVEIAYVGLVVWTKKVREKQEKLAKSGN